MKNPETSLNKSVYPWKTLANEVHSEIETGITFRELLAKDVLCALISSEGQRYFPQGCNRRVELSKLALEYTNALIEALNNETK